MARRRCEFDMGGAEELLSDRSHTLVVIHPGNTTLRIGLGDAQPLSIPHCVAYLRAEGAEAATVTPFSTLGGGDAAQERERRKASYEHLEQRLGVVHTGYVSPDPLRFFFPAALAR
jgi:hypothetical protein